MKSWLDCFKIFSKLLVDTFITLRYDFVRIVDKAATNTRHPGSHTSTTLSPPDHAFAIARNLLS